mmetsp:Transcript_103205/g.181921  ORF Transcript_103205/g.181921 Transcript_103205/m.181921 type:complete len:143 (-) Transcript_103205:1206-1634(-)
MTLAALNAQVRACATCLVLCTDDLCESVRWAELTVFRSDGCEVPIAWEEYLSKRSAATKRPVLKALDLSLLLFFTYACAVDAPSRGYKLRQGVKLLVETSLSTEGHNGANCGIARAAGTNEVMEFFELRYMVGQDLLAARMP